MHLKCYTYSEMKTEKGRDPMESSLRKLRKRSKLNINEIVLALDINISTLYSWENGDRLIPIDKLNRLLNLYNHPINEFDFDNLIQIHEDKKRVKLNA